jgi:enoyl-CoA hydratase/carnithine racemase
MTTIDVERRGAVALVTINNPARKNAVTLEMRQALLDTFRGFVGDDAVRAVVLTGGVFR